MCVCVFEVVSACVCVCVTRIDDPLVFFQTESSLNSLTTAGKLVIQSCSLVDE